VELGKTSLDGLVISVCVSINDVGGEDLSHEELGTETVESHQEPKVGLKEKVDERHEPTVNEMEGYGSKMKSTNKQLKNKEGQD
jgi:hypothetical protein